MITGAGASGSHLMEKQRLVPAVQELWNTWELHAMMLTSLFLQVFLFLFAGWRQRTSNVVLRTVLWLVYLSADSVAVFVLGHLAVRTREPGHQLMSFWAPFVLIHLGGQDTITAFAMQDNQLWTRHLLNLVIQAGVAAYVVGKTSWPDRRLMAAMVLIFLCGCIKYAERTYILFMSDPLTTHSLLSKLGVGVLGMPSIPYLFEDDTINSSKDFWRMTRHILDMLSKGSSVPQRELYMETFILRQNIMSMDAPVNQASNIFAVAVDDHLSGMLPADALASMEDCHNAYEHVRALLAHCYRLSYTKDPIRETCIGTFLSDDGMRLGPNKILIRTCHLLYSLFPYVSTSIALWLFMAAEKLDHGASGADIIVSYLLLVGAIALDVSSVAIFIFFHLSTRFPGCIQPAWRSSKKQWSQQLGQSYYY